MDTFSNAVPGNQYGPTAGMPAAYGMSNNLSGVSATGQSSTNPGAAGSQSGSGYIPGVSVPNYQGSANTTPSTANTATNYAIGPGSTGFEDPTSPQLQGNWQTWLNSQVGQGTPAFNLQTTLPTGGTTQAGAVNAPLNQNLQSLMDYFNTGNTGNNTGLTALNQLAQGTSAIPQWQDDIKAMQQQIGQGQANLKEQYASTGSLGSSEYGSAMSQYQQGTSATQNALLDTIQQQNQQTQLSAASGLTGLQSQLGQYLQGLDQSSITNMMNEYTSTLPQNSPILQYLYGQSNSYAPIFNTKTGASTTQNIASGMGIAGAAAGAAQAGGLGGDLLAGLAAL